MTDRAGEELREYIGELARVARTGQSLSIISGYHLAWWGAIVSLACAFELALMASGAAIHDGYIWASLILVGWIGGRLLQRRLNAPERAGSLSYANRVTRYVWLGVGIGACLIIGAEFTQLADLAGRGYFVVFSLCALGLVATAAAGAEPLLLLSGAGWFLAGFGTLFLPASTQIVFWVTIVSCLVFLVIPGVIIARRGE